MFIYFLYIFFPVHVPIWYNGCMFFAWLSVQFFFYVAPLPSCWTWLGILAPHVKASRLFSPPLLLSLLVLSGNVHVQWGRCRSEAVPLLLRSGGLPLVPSSPTTSPSRDPKWIHVFLHRINPSHDACCFRFCRVVLLSSSCFFVLFSDLTLGPFLSFLSPIVPQLRKGFDQWKH